jgi:hypothetical protein
VSAPLFFETEDAASVQRAWHRTHHELGTVEVFQLITTPGIFLPDTSTSCML